MTNKQVGNQIFLPFNTTDSENKPSWSIVTAVPRPIIVRFLHFYKQDFIFMYFVSLRVCKLDITYASLSRSLLLSMYSYLWGV